MVWGKPDAPAAGAWADDEPEEEHKAPAPSASGPDPDLFPALGEAVKQQQPKKKKGQKMHIGECDPWGYWDFLPGLSWNWVF